jgi:phage-related protein
MIAKYYRASDGSQPVRDFINGLGADAQVVIENQIALLNRFDMLPYPISSQVRGSLRELRCHYGNALYRIFYRRSDHFVVLLHVIKKSTRELPASDIVIAEQRWADFESRMNAGTRVPPRPLGRDAP